MNKLAKKIVDLVLLPQCVGCGKPGSFLCKKCEYLRLTPFYMQLCHVCGVESRCNLVHSDCRSKTNLDGVLIAYAYDKLAKEMVSRLKFKSQSVYVAEIARVVIGILRGRVQSLGVVDITYVPTSRARKWRRGFNQSQLLSKAVAVDLGLRNIRGLRRNKYNSSQVGKGDLGRAENVRGSFVAVDGIGKVERVIIVDDVMTTGATLESCASALKQAGIKEVYGLVFARNPEFGLMNR